MEMESEGNICYTPTMQPAPTIVNQRTPGLEKRPNVYAFPTFAFAFAIGPEHHPAQRYRKKQMRL
jgi:hypothetical protein